MKSVSRIINSGSLVGNHQPQPDQTGELNAFARQNINAIFQRLQAIFPAWRTAFPSAEALAEAKKVWVMALIDARICSTEQISRGMAKARLSESDFFPSAGKFVGWCRLSAEDMGAPVTSSAYHEASSHCHQVMEHTWSHPAVYEAGRRSGWFEMRNGKVSIKQFTDHYIAAIEDLANGAEIKMPQPDETRLEHHRRGKAIKTNEAKRAATEAIQAMRKGL